MKTFCALFLWGLLPLPAQPPKPVVARTELPIQVQQQTQQQSTVKRVAMQTAERNVDARLAGANSVDPVDLTGNSRGIYLPGFGVVMTAEIAIVRLPGPSPFHLTFTAEEKAKARARKVQALPKVREAMKAALMNTAGELQTVPLNEKIILAVNLFYWSWEDSSGLPAQILMQATRQQLTGKLEAIQVQEF